MGISRFGAIVLFTVGGLLGFGLIALWPRTNPPGSAAAEPSRETADPSAHAVPSGEGGTASGGTTPQATPRPGQTESSIRLSFRRLPTVAEFVAGGDGGGDSKPDGGASDQATPARGDGNPDTTTGDVLDGAEPKASGSAATATIESTPNGPKGGDGAPDVAKQAVPEATAAGGPDAASNVSQVEVSDTPDAGAAGGASVGGAGPLRPVGVERSSAGGAAVTSDEGTSSSGDDVADSIPGGDGLVKDSLPSELAEGPDSMLYTRLGIPATERLVGITPNGFRGLGLPFRSSLAAGSAEPGSPERSAADLPAAGGGLFSARAAESWPSAGLPGASMSESDLALGIGRRLVGGVPPVFEPGRFLYDSFESKILWGVESGADHAEIEPAEMHATDGRQALKVRFVAGKKGHFDIRREVTLALPETCRWTLDVFNPHEPMQVRLCVTADAGEQGWRGFDSAGVEVRTGWNRALSLEIKPASMAADEAKVWALARENIMRLSWAFTPRGESEGTIYVDNIRMDADPATANREPRVPEIRRVAVNRRHIECYGILEVSPSLGVTCQDCFDRKQVDLTGTFISPSGKKKVVSGFFYDLGGEQSPAPSWRIRFCPDEIGQWSFVVTVKDPKGEVHSPPESFVCVPGTGRNGTVRVCRSDPRFFERSTGDFFYPIGINVAWAGNYGHYFRKLANAGANYTRVWMCTWNLQLEGPREPGRYNLGVARELDEILAAAADAGICVQVVLEYHGMLQGDWAKNPYNKANGGPCANPWDFFTQPEAIELFKRRLDYVVARWSSSTAIFAWELWNEVDITSNWDHLVTKGKFKDVIAWHQNVCGYLKSIDPYGHLVTTSTSNTNQFDEIFKLDGIDLVPKHFYTESIVEETLKQYEALRGLGKPYFVGEFSGGTDPRKDQEDPRGLRLHAGIWSSFMTPSAGAAMPWWWDIHIEKFDLYHHLEAMARFARGEDRRGQNLRLFTDRVPVSAEISVDVLGLFSPSRAYLWFYNRRALQSPKDAQPIPVLPVAANVAIDGVLAGTYEFEVWDIYEGKVVRSERIVTRENGLVVQVPASANDFAVKIRKLGTSGDPVIRFFR